MPESFVNQATGRCSVDGSKLWFNCNPSYPSHWFNTEWILRRDEKRLLYLHFTMDDNLSLSEQIKERYKSMYAGVFYKRYILGLWALAEGIIYPMYEDALADPPDEVVQDYRLSIDYGTMNAFAALLWEKHNGVWYAVKGYYYSGREKGVTKTDEEYANDLEALVKPVVDNMPARSIFGETYTGRIKTIIDPSAASFITLLRKRGMYNVIAADNDVIDGIRDTAVAMQSGLIKISPSIKEWVNEAEGYVWDESAIDDRPVKINDHYMDSTRYLVYTEKLVIRSKKRYLKED